MSDDVGRVRIGELSRRVGVAPDVLRAWERRYRLLHPTRTAGGFRLYSGSDEARVRAMLAQLARGVAAAEAAGVVLAAEPPEAGVATLAELRAGLPAVLRAYDDAGAHALLDHLFAQHGSDVAMRDVLYPYLRDLGERWARGETDVGEEHFATNILEGRLLALLRKADGDGDNGPRALLACPSGERHSLGLLGLGVALGQRGWLVTYLGADTPAASVRRTVAELRPALVVLAATLPGRVAPEAEALRRIASSVPLLLAGGGASQTVAQLVGARYLAADPVTAAERIVAQTR